LLALELPISAVMKRISDGRSHQSRAGLRWLLPSGLVAVVLATSLLADPGSLDVPASRPISEWSAEVGRGDLELAEEQIGPAIRSWERARVAARLSRQWQGLLAVGDAYLRIGDAVDFRRAFVTTARALYLEALERARDEGSVDGVLGANAALSAIDECLAGEPVIAMAAQAARDREIRRVCESGRRFPWPQLPMNAKGDAS